jgi:hypothetical protein
MDQWTADLKKNIMVRLLFGRVFDAELCNLVDGDNQPLSCYNCANIVAEYYFSFFRIDRCDHYVILCFLRESLAKPRYDLLNIIGNRCCGRNRGL